MAEERVMIFIDGSNFYHGLKRNFGITAIDFYAFSLQLCGTRKFIRTYYSNVPVRREADEERYRRQQRFFEGLRVTPCLEVRLGRLEQRPDGKGVEKGVDIKLAVDMMRHAYDDTYDTAILVSGDGDYVNAIEAVKNLGKHVENAFFEKDQSYHLRQACDVFIPLKREMIESVAVKL